MRIELRIFLSDEDGAITVDWVVLTAACVALGLLAISLISGSIRDNGREASAIMTTYEIDHDFDTEAELVTLQQEANATLNAENATPDPDPAHTN